jgi:hypothetical protein
MALPIVGAGLAAFGTAAVPELIGAAAELGLAEGLGGGLFGGAVSRVKSFWVNEGESAFLSTGGRQLNSVRATLKADEEAAKFYEMIRNNPSNMDVNLISKNTGMLGFQVQRIKQHLFYDTHQLASGVERFAPDIEIVDAWARLQQGNFVKQDINLLQHEYFEARFKGIFKTDYMTAHTAANDSLRTWDPYEFITTPNISWRP